MTTKNEKSVNRKRTLARLSDAHFAAVLGRMATESAFFNCDDELPELWQHDGPLPIDAPTNGWVN